MKQRITLIFLLLLSSYSKSFHSYFRNYSVENGLPFIQTNTIFQDSKGYLWIGGYGGLSKFDGNIFQNFSPKNGLINYSVTTISEDYKGRIWIGTIKGISCYDGNKFTNYNKENSIKIGLENETINKIICNNEKIWIATKKGLYYFIENKFYKIENLDFKINTLLETKDNQILLGSDLGVFSINKSNNKVNFIGSCPEISAITEFENNFIITTLSGLYKLNPSTKNLIEFKDKHVNSKKLNSIQCIDNIVYIASDDGLIKLEKNVFSNYKISDYYNSNLLSCLWSDDEKNLWIGSYAGLYRYRSDDFISYSKEDGITSNFIFQVLRTKQNKLFVASGGNGIYIENKDGVGFKNYSIKDGLIDDYVWSACTDKNGNIWCGTNEGISVYNGQTFKSFTQANGLLNNFCITTFCDNNGVIWIGNKGGVSRFENDKFTTLKFPDQLDCDVSAIYKTKNNDMLFGAYQGGLFKYDGKKLTNFGKEIGIKSESVMAIEEDDFGNLFIGTFDGLFIYKNKKLINLDSENGLSSDLVYQLKIDGKEKYLWIGTNQSLNRFSLEKYNKTGEKSIYQIGKNDGFSGVECNTGAVLLEGDSTLWFGTVNGLYRFNIKEFKENTRPSKTAITGIKINYEISNLEIASKLDYEQNNITFYFTGICFTNPEKVLYTIKLEGYDKTWRPASHINIANYPNLPPGNYTFKVKSCNNEGVWNNNAAIYTFSISPPWYKTLIFRLVAIALIIVFVYLFLRNRANNIRETERKKIEQEMAIAENELKALRSQMNPHFIFNSLNSIQHFVISNNSEKASKYLNKFSKLIRLILSHSEKQLITLAEEIELLKLYVELEQVRFEGKFSLIFEIEKDLDIDFIELPTMLIQPFVENAILHGLAPKEGKGILKISFTNSNSNIICIVEDDGIGRKKSYSMKGTGNSNNLSMATKNTTERIELLKKINDKEYSFVIFDLEENQKSGTRVEITFPNDI